MGDTERQSQPKSRVIEHIVPEGMTWQYTNNLHIAMSIWDVRVIFGSVESTTDESIRVSDVARIVMSPQHAKSLAILLNTRVKLYEEKWGPLPDVASSILENVDLP